jgi:hypothetical protein
MAQKRDPHEVGLKKSNLVAFVETEQKEEYGPEAEE